MKNSNYIYGAQIVEHGMKSAGLLSRSRWFALACIVPALLVSSLVPSGSMQEKPAAKPVGQAVQETGGALKPYALTLPSSVVKVNMQAIPAGTLTVAGKKVPVKAFWIADTETTWEAFDTFIASGPPSPAYDQTAFPADAVARPSKSYILPDLGWGHHGYPAINISILSARMYCRWLSAQTGKKYRLPSDVEWEYACRAGSTSTKPPLPAQMVKAGWFSDNSGGRTHPVGKKLPNAWKLYDMDGNTGEWALDAADKHVLCGGTFKDKIAVVTPAMKKHQTPAWQETDPQLPKSRWWLADGSFCGFRIVCEP